MLIWKYLGSYSSSCRRRPSNKCNPIVRIGGTFRSLTNEGLLYMKERIKQVVRALFNFLFWVKLDFLILVEFQQVVEMQALVHRCTAELDFEAAMPRTYPVTINDETLYKFAKKIGEELVGYGNVQVEEVTMGAEDFSFYSQRIPATAFWLGIKNATVKSDKALHSPYFVLDENALPIGAAFHAAVALSYLDANAETY